MDDYIYMKVTRDEYELPVAVADSARELAILLGLEPKTVRKVMYASKKKDIWCCYRKVYIGEKEN